jgi:hypothetical protein
VAVASAVDVSEEEGEQGDAEDGAEDERYDLRVVG